MSIRSRFVELDRALRGETTEVRAGAIVPVAIALAAFYGACMGSFAVVSGRAGAWKQMLSSTVKVPALFVFTLLVTFPSLYVFAALMGSRLTMKALVRLLVAAMGVAIALLASFGTITAFFAFTTNNHPFMVVLNALAFTIAGLIGQRFLRRGLQNVNVEAPAEDAVRVRNLFRAWAILFALVGAQMSWVLRPFVGGETEFALFRDRGSNFFAALFALIQKLVW